MARPKKGNEIAADTQLGVRVPADTREQLVVVASRNNHSLTDEIRAAIDAHLAKAEKRK